MVVENLTTVAPMSGPVKRKNAMVTKVDFSRHQFKVRKKWSVLI